MAAARLWRDSDVFRVLQDQSPTRIANISYALRLLNAEAFFADPVSGKRKDFEVLRDMANRLRVSASSILTEKQANYAYDLMMRHRLHVNLAIIFRRMELSGEEILIDEAVAQTEIAEDPEPEAAPSPSAFRSHQWGMF
jgi:hypothetical protein